MQQESPKLVRLMAPENSARHYFLFFIIFFVCVCGLEEYYFSIQAKL